MRLRRDSSATNSRRLTGRWHPWPNIIDRVVDEHDVVPRLVFVHGAGLSSAMWAPQVARFAGALQVTTVDLPGHGSRADERFSLDGARQIVADELIRDTHRPVVLIGLSLGGYVAMAVAGRYPQLTAGLVLSGCSIDYSQGRYRLLTRVTRLAVALWPKPALNALQTRALRRTYPAYAQTIIDGGLSWAGLRDSVAPLAGTDWRSVMDTYPHPVLVVTGENDRRNCAQQDDQVRRLRNGRARVMAGAGHLCNLDQPAQFSQLVYSFAQQLANDPYRFSAG